jgi:hypothetical protein
VVIGDRELAGDELALRSRSARWSLPTDAALVDLVARCAPPT